MKKNQYLFATMMALALVATGCSNENELVTNNSMKTVNVKAGIDTNADSRVAYTEGTTSDGTQGYVVNWESSDALSVYASATNKGDFTTPTIAADAHYASFSGSFATELTAKTDVYAYVNKSAVTLDGTTVTTDLSNQDGTAANAENHDILFSAGTYDPSATVPLSLNFSHKMSFLKLALTFPASETGTTTTNIVLRGEGLYNKVSLNAADATLASSQEGDITVPSATITGNIATIIVCVYPNSLKNLYVYAAVGSTIYKFTVGTKSLAGQKLYRVNRSDPSADTESLSVATAFDGGTGTASDPYQIATLPQLRYLASLINAKNTNYNTKYYKQTADISLGDGIAEWVPIGVSRNGGDFQGTYDGNNQSITGVMKIYPTTTTSNVAYGLFGAIEGGTIENVNNEATIIAPVNMTNDTFLGAIVGRIFYLGTVYHCSNSGEILASCPSVGGIVGGVYTSGSSRVSLIEACCNTANIHNGVTGTTSSICTGGILANGISRNTSYVNIVGCYNTGLIIECAANGSSTGGIEGYSAVGTTGSGTAYYGNIAACWSSATTIVGTNKGTLAGAATNSLVAYDYGKTLSGIKLIGYNNASSTTGSNSFDDTLSADMITGLNTAWSTADNALGRTQTYQFDSSGAIIAK